MFFPFVRVSAPRGERKNTASVSFGQTQKSEMRCRAAPIDLTHLVNTHDSTQTRRCGPLSDCATAIFRARSAQCFLYEHALSGQPEGPLRHAIAWSCMVHSLGKSKAKLCDKEQVALSLIDLRKEQVQY